MSDEPDVGSLSDELRKLGIALGKLDSHEHAEDGAPSEPQGAPDAHEQPIACKYCPICQLVALARGQRTDSLDSLIGAASGLISALTSYVEQKAAHEASANESGAPTGEERVERIDLQ